MNVQSNHPLSASLTATRWAVADARPAAGSRRLLVALARDRSGKRETQFEAAECFLLYEKDGNKSCYIGRQPCVFSGTQRDRQRTLDLLKDCDVVMCADISTPCRRSLASMGVECRTNDGHQ